MAAASTNISREKRLETMLRNKVMPMIPIQWYTFAPYGFLIINSDNDNRNIINIKVAQQQAQVFDNIAYVFILFFSSKWQSL